ncbi:MAG: GGDEF domain-containing protein [Bacilli bacterium]
MEIAQHIIASTFASCTIIICMLFIFIGNKFRDRYINALFFIFLGVLVLLTVNDIIEYYFSFGDIYTPWRTVGSAFSYILRPMVLLNIILILLRREEKRNFWIIWIPLILLTFFVVTSPWTKLVFWFNETNNFQRGPLGFMPHIISGIYMVLLLFLTFHFSSKFDKLEVTTICLASAFALIAIFIEGFLGEKFLTSTASSISCLIYYLYFYIRQSKKDELTDVFNRQCFFQDTEKIKGIKTILIMADVNQLKEINDTKGHSEGDRALIALGHALLKVSGKDYRSYRIGGDEFMVVGINKTEEDAKTYIAKVVEILSKTPYMAAFGYAIHNIGESYDETIKNSDAKMYERKKLDHSESRK